VLVSGLLTTDKNLWKIIRSGQEQSMFERRIGEIPKKLEAARRIPGSESWFGVSKHHFRLRPRIAEPDLVAFERHRGVLLPDDYRQFLLLAGDGGAGPYYGIEPLSAWDFWFEEEAKSPEFLSSPCPLVDNAAVRQAWNAALERDARRARGIINVGATPSQAWQAFLPSRWWEWGTGSIHICDQGCTYSARLIVSGEARGRVVYLDVQEWYPPYFVRDLSFIDWYGRWLNDVAAGKPPDYFGFDNPEYGS
jgi:hypothetical protein